MEFVLNELSLSGQYDNEESFIRIGLENLSKVINDLISLGINQIYKSPQLWTRKSSPEKTIGDVIFKVEYRTNDTLRRLKRQLAYLNKEPYIISEETNNRYFLLRADDEKEDVTKSSLPYAVKNNFITISFTPSLDFNIDQLKIEIVPSDEIVTIRNIWLQNQLIQILWEHNIVDIPTYIKSRFFTKFDFSEISGLNGLNLIDKENVDLFIHTFQKIETLDWQSLITDKGLDYKAFTKNRNTKDFFKNAEWTNGVFKFRVNQEIRCFCNNIKGKLYILRIDLDHHLSDLG